MRRAWLVYAIVPCVVTGMTVAMLSIALRDVGALIGLVASLVFGLVFYRLLGRNLVVRLDMIKPGVPHALIVNSSGKMRLTKLVVKNGKVFVPELSESPICNFDREKFLFVFEKGNPTTKSENVADTIFLWNKVPVMIIDETTRLPLSKKELSNVFNILEHALTVLAGNLRRYEEKISSVDAWLAMHMRGRFNLLDFMRRHKWIVILTIIVVLMLLVIVAYPSIAPSIKQATPVPQIQQIIIER